MNRTMGIKMYQLSLCNSFCKNKQRVPSTTDCLAFLSCLPYNSIGSLSTYWEFVIDLSRCERHLHSYLEEQYLFGSYRKR